MKIKLTKINTVDNPFRESASSIDEYGKSVWNGLFSTFSDDHLSPPIEYSIVGNIVGDITVGKSLIVDRESRNGVKVPGIFSTSIVQKIGYNDDNKIVGFTTMNSVYTIEYLD